MAEIIDVESMFLRILKHTFSDIEKTVAEHNCTITEAIDILLEERKQYEEGERYDKIHRCRCVYKILRG